MNSDRPRRRHVIGTNTVMVLPSALRLISLTPPSSPAHGDADPRRRSDLPPPAMRSNQRLDQGLVAARHRARATIQRGHITARARNREIVADRGMDVEAQVLEVIKDLAGQQSKLTLG
jgi:hypothetical protein